MNFQYLSLIISLTLLFLNISFSFAQNENNSQQKDQKQKALEYDSELIPGVSEEQADAFMHDMFAGKTTEFIAQYWEQKPFYIRNRQRSMSNMGKWNSRVKRVFSQYKLAEVVLANSTAYYDEVTEDDIEETDEDGRVPLKYGRDLKLVKRTQGKDGEWWTGMLPNRGTRNPDLISEETIISGLMKQFSVIMNRINFRNKDVLHIGQVFERFWGFPTDINMFFTPQGVLRRGQHQNSQGFEAHFDKMCSFVIQIQGYKEWALYDDALHMPLPHQQFKPKVADLGEPSMVVDLKPGDVLFFPRGWVHEARTSSSDSIHLTVGVDTHSITYSFLVHHAIDALADVEKRKSNNPLRDPLPGISSDLSYRYLAHIILQRYTLENSEIRQSYPHNEVLKGKLNRAFNDFNREELFFSLMDQFSNFFTEKSTKQKTEYLQETLEYIHSAEQSSWDPYVSDELRSWQPTDEQITEMISKLTECFDYIREKGSFKPAHRRLRDQVVHADSSLKRYRDIERSLSHHQEKVDRKLVTDFSRKLSSRYLKQRKIKEREAGIQQKMKEKQEKQEKRNQKLKSKLSSEENQNQNSKHKNNNNNKKKNKKEEIRKLYH
eukprot:gb/GECH01009678.1/.p1 GENE.gb/GECH01009678.1/~~gb/GECH01009678.1/.p1  ORF type:complete len:604 (+),score=149.62 gb/GECH01009678.1/:1-1812(+)